MAYHTHRATSGQGWMLTAYMTPCSYSYSGTNTCLYIAGSISMEVPAAPATLKRPLPTQSCLQCSCRATQHSNIWLLASVPHSHHLHVRKCLSPVHGAANHGRLVPHPLPTHTAAAAGGAAVSSSPLPQAAATQGGHPMSHPPTSSAVAIPAQPLLPPPGTDQHLRRHVTPRPARPSIMCRQLPLLHVIQGSPHLAIPAPPPMASPRLAPPADHPHPCCTRTQ